MTTETPDCQSAAHATIAAALLTSTLINSPVSNALAAAHVASEILAALNGVGLGPGHETAACVAVANAEPAPPKSVPASPWQDAADHAAGRLTAAEQASGPENIIALLRARLQRELDEAKVFVDRAGGTLAELTSAHVSDHAYIHSGVAAVIDAARGSLLAARSRTVDPQPRHRHEWR